jgi:lysine-specific demethylase 8
VPPFCSVLAPEDTAAPTWCEVRNEAPLVSAWLGPAGTVSPLHNDPYHNILVQVRGLAMG